MTPEPIQPLPLRGDQRARARLLSAQALAALEATAEEVLPPEMGYECADMLIGLAAKNAILIWGIA